MLNTTNNRLRVGLLLAVATAASSVWGDDRSADPEHFDCLVNPSVTGLVSCLPAVDDPTTEYRWEMGDGTHYETGSEKPHIYHTYREPGEYTVTLTVRRGGSVTSTRSVLSIPEPAGDGSDQLAGGHFR